MSAHKREHAASASHAANGVNNNHAHNNHTHNNHEHNHDDHAHHHHAHRRKHRWYELVDIAHVPHWLRFNPFVTRFYRPQIDALECCKSVLGLHNESANIWSHWGAMLTMLYAMGYEWYVAPDYVRSEPSFYLLLFSIFSVGLNFFFSVAYHTLMPCCRSKTGYDFLLNTDVVFVAGGMAGSFSVPLMYGYRCIDGYAQHAMAFGFYAFFVVVILTCCYAVNVVHRGLVLLMFIITRMTLGWVIEVQKAEHTGEDAALWHHWYSFLGIFVGGVLNVTRFPERVWPGRFDLWGNSHQLMHCITWWASLHVWWANRKDIYDWHQTPCGPI